MGRFFMFGQDTPIFSFTGPFGVRVEVGGSIFILLLLFVGIGSSPLYGLIIFGLIMLAIFLHELGHAWGALVQGVRVDRIMIYGGGGFCQHASTGRYKSEFIVAMGPIVNLGLWAIASLIAGMMEPSLARGLIRSFATINLFLAILNMVPVQPLDGGKLLHLGLLRILRPREAMQVAGGIGLVLAILWIPTMVWLFLKLGFVLLFFPPIAAHWRMVKGEFP